MTQLLLPDLRPGSLVAVDTETSGLFVDDGARVSVISIAWYDGGGTPGNPHFAYPKTGQPLPKRDPNLHTAVYAFDHGWETPLGVKPVARPRGKGPAQYRGRRKSKVPQSSLFDDGIDAAPNLDPRFYPELLEWLQQHALVFHNAKFDLHILNAGLRGRERDWPLPDLSRSVTWDTQVCNPVLWPEFPTSLKPTAQRLWGEQEAQAQKELQNWLDKNKVNGNPRYDLAPWSLLGPYAAHDADMTIRLYDVQQLVIDVGERLDPDTLRRVCEREIDYAVTLYRMEERGFPMDAEAMLKEAEKLSREIAEATWDLRTEIHQQFPRRYPTPNDVPSITEHLIRHLWYAKEDEGGLGLFPSKMTDTGPSVSQDVVRELKQHGAPFAAGYEKLNTLETAHSMWYSTWPRMVGRPEPGWHPDAPYRLPRLRTSYNQSRTHQEKKGTISGRLSVERVQLQAIPHDYQIPDGIRPVRDFFMPDPGYQLWEIDVSQAEYRVAAGLSQCQAWIKRFEEGDDAHSATARMVWKIDEDHPDWKERRQVAKRLNFGCIYGAGADTTRNQIRIYTGLVVSSEEMEAWLAEFRRAYPEIGRLSRRTQRLAERNRAIVLAGGRERWFAPYENEHKAFNQLIQGSVAEMMKEAQIEVEARYPGVQLLQIHDSIIVEPRADEAQDLVAEISKIVVDIFESEFNAPFKCDSKQWQHGEAA